MAMPTLRVEAGFVAAASTSTLLHLDDPTRGKLDTGTLASADVFTDVTTDLRAFTITRGASRAAGPLVQYEASRSTIALKDNSRYYDPTNLSGPYVAAGVTLVTPMRPVRIIATHAGTAYNLFRGFADSWTHNYEGPRNTWVTLQATDAIKVLSAVTRTAVAAVGASEDSGARVSRILDSASWPASDRVIDTGNSTLQATTLDGGVMDELRLVTDTEIGELYVDGQGRVVFRRRRAILEDTRSAVSQATFGSGGGSELPFESVTLSYDDTQLVNLARVTRSGGAEQTATDATSVASYLTHTYEASGLLMESDSVATDYAAWVVYQSKDPELRFESITLQRNATSATEDLLFAQMLGREIGDRITIVHRPPGGGTAITRDCFIRGIEHTYEPGFWQTRWVLASATHYQFLVLDHATQGQLDNNALAY